MSHGIAQGVGVSYTLHLGDCLTVLPTLTENSIDSIVCDPPYGLSFMNKNWDHGVPGVPFWEAALRVAKPGAMLLAFGGTRTHHRLMVAIEDAGWEIRDCLMWLYGSGFPKSMDIGKAIDKAAGAEREVIGERPIAYADSDCWSVPNRNADLGNDKSMFGVGSVNMGGTRTITAPATDAAKQWDGWGTALKPAWEPIILAMKPLDKNFANNALLHGVAGLNVDGCRIPANGETLARPFNDANNTTFGKYAHFGNPTEPQGRWPANVLLDEEAAAMLDKQTGQRTSGVVEPHHKRNTDTTNGIYGKYQTPSQASYGDSGGASRFFKIIKYDKDDLCIPVSFAENNLSQSSAHVDFVLSLAAIAVSLEETRSKDMTSRFINETQNALRLSGASDTPTILSIAQRYLQEFAHMLTELSSANPANNAEIQRLTSITAIIQSLLNTNGYAENVTSPTTFNNSALGAKGLDSGLRFAYVAKAAASERNKGLDDMPTATRNGEDYRRKVNTSKQSDGGVRGDVPRANFHPTVKPVELMRYLCRLTKTPLGGTVLDPFMGSGSTGCAAVMEGRSFVGIEISPEYHAIALRRLQDAAAQPMLFALDA